MHICYIINMTSMYVCAWLPVCHLQSPLNFDSLREWRMRSHACILCISYLYMYSMYFTHIYDIHICMYIYEYSSFAGFSLLLCLLSGLKDTIFLVFYFSPTSLRIKRYIFFFNHYICF
ncbi:hypothetical protein ES319_D05G313900v1 [Gossypium barbadense]|uniref:NADH:quinone oxidoreductase/Mrp antiporter membrane subunit domain-containing protein n=2 Tax=Gossypium TaxID=3633 RepID=A0A5J5RJI3_GOSBA|nr:hypothetical protein ES319_D05G313900v1 [Gossypium barbadense]TYG70656.1 hypothetical protein ES288_D05G331000v1 [Gossypium darwinii]